MKFSFGVVLQSVLGVLIVSLIFGVLDMYNEVKALNWRQDYTERTIENCVKQDVYEKDKLINQLQRRLINPL